MLGGLSLGEKLSTCTDQDKLRAQDSRTNARKEVLSSRDAKQQIFKDADLDGKEFLAFYTTELAWWDSHPALCPLDITTRITAFRERQQEYEPTILQTLWKQISAKDTKEAQEIINKLSAELRQQLQTKLNEKLTAIESASPKELKPSERTVSNDFWDAFKVVSAFLIPVAWILIGIRCGSLAANDILYKPLAYRILAFGYTFIGAPLFMFYYALRWLYGYMMDDISYTPRFEGIFPIRPYTVKEGEPISLYDRFFGYRETPELLAWMTTKREEEQQGWLKALETTNTIMQEILKAKEEADKME